MEIKEIVFMFLILALVSGLAVAGHFYIMSW